MSTAASALAGQQGAGMLNTTLGLQTTWQPVVVLREVDHVVPDLLGSFEFEIQYSFPQLELQLRGELDVLTAASLDVPPVNAGEVGRLIIDLSDLSFCDVAGVQRLQELADCFAGSGVEVHMLGAGRVIRRMSRITGLLDGYLREPGDEPTAVYSERTG